jgi:hypothetical protein
MFLPHHNVTPGVINPAVMQENIGRTICKNGWTATVRPSVSFTDRIKVRVIPLYGHHDLNLDHYELDHLIPLEIGGAPRDQKNLWPQPYAGEWGARKKDVLEKKLNRMVCGGAITLKKAQRAISTDWVAAYKRFVPTL